ncbi:putative integral peroxisomal membrane peroxin [Lyophyllum shimeji]|uniref:Integral peroxisomal membrane peroxin n=1 Tax=Lyophyllum shimeji TaxID=47721 RepID=A0A9P3PI13_LYOSH|nr:putative integral peroxisomal membrane peroxin [Lyophyllum shimeji]
MSDQPSIPPPPACMSRDDYSAANAARRRLAPPSRFPRFLSLPNLRSRSPPSRKQTSHSLPVNVTERHAESQEPASLISLDSAKLTSSDESNDRYEWAIVYENQRGMTLFSIPYYSRLSLLPSDPPPFTIPNASSQRSEQLSALTDFQLPDGNWKWVSKCWMIDMRSDAGEVQHDGFEYNSLFRTHNWSADVGFWSAGGWVRRRRWIRLMMRPGKTRAVQHGEERNGQSPSSIDTGLDTTLGRQRDSTGSSLLPSSLATESELLDGLHDIWMNDDVEANWWRCRVLMRRLGRDGRKLELWRTWLSHHHQDNQHAYDGMNGRGNVPNEKWIDDDMSVPSHANSSTSALEQLRPPPKEYLLSVLRTHGRELLHSFIYPDSRAKFIAMLGVSGLLPELNVGLGIGFGASEMDFWSYTNGLMDQFPILASSSRVDTEY